MGYGLWEMGYGRLGDEAIRLLGDEAIGISDEL
jgi:hypothetical protein